MSNFGVDMDSGDEFPGVIDLNVNGVEHRALLSTLVKDENSLLAAMFTGQHPVHKDKNGRYFLQANPQTFHFILHFLHYDEFPFHVPVFGRRGLFGGFGTGFQFGAGGGLQCQLNETELKAVYADSVKLRLSSLTQRLEQYKPILAELKMEEYKKSINCYDDLLKKIISTISADVMYHETVYTIRLDQDFRTTYQDKCCEHECKHANLNVFSQANKVSINKTVKAPCEVTLTLLSALIKDLLLLGYCIQGLVTSCGFHCKKSIRQPKYFSFSDQVKKCCGEEMLLIMFRFESDQNLLSYPQTFGQNGCFGSANGGTSFGQQNIQKGSSLFGNAQNSFGFGSVPRESQFSFGGGQESQSAFGGGQGSQLTFGGGQGSQSAFGGSQGSQSAFGGSQGSQSTFGGSQGSQSAFGGGQGSQSTFGGGQGSQPAFGGGQGSRSTFGGGQGSQSAFGGDQGSQSAFGGGQGSQSAFGGGQGSQSAFGGGQGSQSAFGGGQGSQSAFGGGQGSQSAFGGGQGLQPAVGRGFTFGSPQQKEFTNSSGSQAKGASLFGLAKPAVSKTEIGFGLLGSSQQTQKASDNNTFKFIQKSQTASAGFSFGTPAPILQASKFSTPRQDILIGSQTSSESIPSKGQTSSFIPTSVNSFSSGFSFGANQQASPVNKSGQLFGCSASFTSPFKMPNSEQTAFKADTEKTETASQDESVEEEKRKDDSPSIADDDHVVKCE